MAKRTVRTKPRSATSDDQYLGKRLRLARFTAKMSQAELGNMLGVSFQQIQKYEKGTNRVSAIRLEQIAKALDVPSSFFHQGAATNGPDKDGPPSVIQMLVADRDVLKLAEIMLGMPKESRSALLHMARAVAQFPGR